MGWDPMENPMKTAKSHPMGWDGIGLRNPSHCATLDDGFYLTSNFTCEIKVCECENGSSRGIHCPNHGDEFCTCFHVLLLN